MIGRLRRQMKAAANPEKAAGMRAYMKSTMPYYGINMPDVRAIIRDATQSGGVPVIESGFRQWEEVTRALPPALAEAASVAK